jgi:F-type H+-transporting ATPase subunit delta
MSTDQETLKVARNYARALFTEVADEDRDACLTLLTKLADIVESDKLLRQSLQNPTYSKEERAEVFARIAAILAAGHPDQLGQLLQRISYILVQHHRIDALSALRVSFAEQLYALKQKSKIAITSAFELPHDERVELESSLRATIGKRIEVSYHVDNSILGGVIIESSGKVFDNSVAGRLAELRSELRA